MTNENLVMALGKVIVAAAWADGQVTQDEINSLKDLLFRLPFNKNGRRDQLTEAEWARLEIYIDSPVEADERVRLISDLKRTIRSQEDKDLVISALEDLIRADGVVTEEEEMVFAEVKAALDDVDTGLFGALTQLIDGAVERRSEAVANAPNREEHFEDYVKNKIFYAVRRRLGSRAADFDLSETDLRKLSLAGGLMARVAYADKHITEDEFNTIVFVLQRGWGLSREAATLVVEVAVSEVCKDLDYFRLSRQFSKHTTIEERVAFINTLFTIAKADGKISTEENQEILDISFSLHVTKDHLNSFKRTELSNL